MNDQPILWYFADPMCSWCWGFSPVMGAIRERYRERLRIALVVGGLRPGTTESVSERFREQILGHWREVRQHTGQPFAFQGALPDGFVYDTEPACRAVVAMGQLKPDATFAYFTAVQQAFYVEQRDITQAQTLASLAADLGIPPATFLGRFATDEIKAKTRAHFQHTRQAGIRGFPTAVLQNGAGYALLTSGYRPFAELEPEIEAWLDAAGE
jgi:putative protein-disulfide isomerase